MPKYFTHILACLVGAVFASCSDSTTDAPANAEFVAKDSDFASYATWTQTTTPRIGLDPAGKLGGAHEELDSTVSRYIHINNASATRSNAGQYPNGTLFAKAMKAKDGTVKAITAMAKRGGEYNKAKNGWEYMLIDPATRKITARGDTLWSGACQGCHGVASAQDYIFTKP